LDEDTPVGGDRAASARNVKQNRAARTRPCRGFRLEAGLAVTAAARLSATAGTRATAATTTATTLLSAGACACGTGTTLGCGRASRCGHGLLAFLGFIGIRFVVDL
jgi:hypothetical protein